MSTTLDSLREATHDLLFPSEVDRPIKIEPWVYEGDDFLHDALQKWYQSTSFEKISLDDFFGELCEDQSDPTAAKFRKLREIIEGQLSK
jgi:hypothetical protein